MSALEKTAERSCAICRHFIDEAVELEKILNGLLILGSAMGESRGDQGLCRIHDRYLLPGMICDHFLRRNAS